MTTQNTTTLKIGDTRKRGLVRHLGARLLRALAGSTAAVQRQNRRGSFLVIVVGTLALMSVFAIIYIAIGRSDVGQKVGLQRNVARDDIPNQFADYVAQIIADNAVTLAPAGEDLDLKVAFNDQLIRRQTWDYPATQFKTSNGSGTARDFKSVDFDPVGHGTDPFLASMEPIEANLGNTLPIDWLHISNVSPDGRFVNLANLREVDKFNNPMQFDPTVSSSTKRTAMRKNLTLLSDKGVPIGNLPYGGASSPDIIAHWDSYQRGLFRPAKDNSRPPGNRDYLLNSYADADGDGMLDSRWFELYDARDLANIKSFLDASDRYRYFFATRIIDLSGLVNFTTATDDLQAPSKDAPAGVRPSEIDIRRLLTLEDAYQLNLGLGYDKIESALSVNGRDPTGKLPDNYSLPAPGYNQAVAVNVGARAYDALYRAISTGHVPVTPTSPTGTPFVFKDSVERADFYSNLTGAAGTFAYDAASSRYELANLFGAADYLDLFTYRACNNPDVSAAIEDILGGRFWGKAGEGQRYSPLRDNRGFDLELADRDPTNKGIADAASMVLFATDIRHLFTPYSGARPLRSTVVGPGVTTLAGTELKQVPSSGVAAAFKAYADALIPDSANISINGKTNVVTWPNATDPTEYNRVKFSHYGYTTPELGLRLSAHLAANFDQAIQGGQSAKPYTLLVDEVYRDSNDATFSNITGLNKDYKQGVTRQYPKDMAQRKNFWSWWADGKALDLGDNTLPVNLNSRPKSRLADSDLKSSTVTAPAVNVFAIVPEPVITAVACYTVYTDAPEALGGDDESKQGTNSQGNPEGLCTIRGAIGFGNTDFVMQVLAFQLSNPFDVGINLSSPDFGPGIQQDRFEYYIEYNGHCFRLDDLAMQTNPTGAGELQGVTLAPGQTRVFFATSQSIADIQSRWDKIPAKLANGADVQSEAIAVNWFNKQFKEQLGFGNAVGDPVWIEEMKFQSSGAKGYTAQRVKYSTYSTTLLKFNQPGPGIPGHPAGTSDVVRLWRALRTPRMDATAGPDAAESAISSAVALPAQYLENDQLVDRLRDPSQTGTATLNVSMPNTNFKIKDATANPETDNSAGNFNHGLTIARYGVIHRPGTPGNPASRIGALPGFMLEKKWASAASSLNTADLAPPGTDITDYQSGTAGALTFGDFVHNQATLGTQVIIDFGTDMVGRYAKNPPPANLSGVPFNKLMVELTQGLKTNTLRLADTLLPLAIGPEFDPTISGGKSFDDQHLTLQEALAQALDYDRPTNPADIYYGLGAATGFPTGPKVDRGNLVLDDFVPFYDADNDGIFKATAASPDQRRGMGIPMALSVLDTFRTLPAKYGSLTRSTIGQVNINTAPLSVVRVLPMLSPSTVNWWGTPSSSQFPHDARSDIAATLISYRDKVDVLTRPVAGTPGPKVSFHDTGTIKPSEIDKLDGRDTSTEVTAIREQPGFRSVGEIMLARDRTPPFNKQSPNNIDYLGFNTSNDGLEGVNSTTYAGNVVNGIKDDYEEKLMVANGVLNSISVRSDVYAVWFLVHGYQKTDAQRADGQPLADTDPLVPSIQRRFLMIVDRSNVISKGQKPRIVLLKEVPLQ